MPRADEKADFILDQKLPPFLVDEFFKVGEEKNFEVKNMSDADYNKIYKTFLKDYKPKKKSDILELPDKIKTKCIAISAISREFPTPYVDGIWKIE